MKQDRTRHIAVKSLLNSSEFLALQETCRDSDTSISRTLRDLANWWVDWKKFIAQTEHEEGPRLGQNMAMFQVYRGGTPFPQLI